MFVLLVLCAGMSIWAVLRAGLALRRLEWRDRTIASLEARLKLLEARQAADANAASADPTAAPPTPLAASTGSPERGGPPPATSPPAAADLAPPLLVTTLPAYPGERRPPPVMPIVPSAPPSPVVPPPVIAAEPSSSAISATTLPDHDSAPSREEPPVPAWSPPAAPPPPRVSAPPIDWESFVGVKMFSWIAGIALVFAAVFFLRYSIEHGWLGPPIRMAIGLAVGSGLLILCELRAARRYAVTANALDAAGIAILFATLFASHVLWHLIPQLPTFALMALVTAVAVLLSIRRDSPFIALLGLAGGFATPALLSTGEDNPIGLFTYLFLLNGGLAWVSYRKQWPVLSAVSVAFTAVYQWGWVFKFLDASRLPLAMSIFLVFPMLQLAALAMADRAVRRDGESLFTRAALLSTAMPVVFAVYMAAVPAYGAHYLLLFGFLFLVVAGLSSIAVASERELLYTLAGLSTVAAFAVWFAVSYDGAAWPNILAVVIAFVGLHIAIPVVAKLRGHAFDEPAAYLIAPALMFAFPILVAIEPAAAAPGLLFASLFALMAALAAAALATGVGRIHFLAAFFALATEALWSTRYLTPERLLPALTMYAVFGLFYLGVPLVAARLGRRLEPRGSGAVVLFVSLLLLFFLAAGPVAASALWGMALLLAILNLGLFVEAAAGTLPILSLLGIVVSWVVIAVWWASAMTAAILIPSLGVVAGFALLTVGGGLWAQQRAAAGADEAQVAVTPLQQGLYLALVGHLFLLFVASQASLAIPPWPMFGVLVVLDLALGTAALYSRAELHAGALGFSQLVLLVWVIVAHDAPWPLVGMVAAAVVVAQGLLWLPMSRRLGRDEHGFAIAAVGSAFLAEAVAIAASLQTPPPQLLWLIVDHVGLLVVLLAIAGAKRLHWIAAAAVIPAAAQGGLWIAGHLAPETWSDGLVFVAALYVPFLAYPVLLGARAERSPEPHLAAVMASAVTFVLARSCIMTGGHSDVIGLLPVIQALCLLGVLVSLLRIETPGQRQLGRLALVAGAALAFVTVAIPLQLERQWITIGWALEAAALAWLYRRIPHRGLLAVALGLGAAVFARLSLNPAVFSYHPRGAEPILNSYLYTYLVSALALFGSARLLRATDDRLVEPVRASDLLTAAGGALLFLLLNIEIADFYSIGDTLTFNLSAGLAQDLTYTIGWALFAIVTLAIAISRNSRITRIASLALLVVTVLKCFLHDLWRLGGLYRVSSLVGLAVCLALVALLLQRFVLGAQEETT